MKPLNFFLIFFFLFSINAYSLPKCEGGDPNKWDNCIGVKEGNKWGWGTYNGEWKDGKYHGRGTFTWGDGEKYDGMWLHGKMNGFGTKTVTGYKYVGEWKDDASHGLGTLIAEKAYIYSGYWKDGKYHGRGTLTWDVADYKRNIYVGEFKDDKFIE